MTIDPEIVARAKSNAVALFRPHPPASLPSPRPSRSVSPLLSHRPSRVPDPYHYHSDYDRRLLLSPYTDTEVDYYPMPELCNRHAYPAALTARRIPTSRPSPAPAPPPAPTPLHSPGWAVANQLPPPQIHPAYHHRTVSHLHEELHGLNASANPWLSAIPRSPTPGAAPSNNNNNWHPYHPRSHHHHHHNHNHHHQPPPLPTSLPAQGITLAPLRLKRRFAQLDHHPTDADTPYDAGSSHAGSPSASPISVVVDLDDEQPTTTSTTREKSIQVPNLSQPTTPSRPTTSGGLVVRNNNDEEEEVNTTTTTTMTNTTSTPVTSTTIPPRRSARAASERDVAIMLIHMRAAMRGRRDGEEEEAADMVPARGSRDADASASAASFAAVGAGGAFPGVGASAGGASAGDASAAAAAGGSAGGALATPSGSASPAVSGREGRWEDGEHETRSKRRRTVEGG